MRNNYFKRALRYAGLFAALTFSLCANSQVVTTVPEIITPETKNVVITFHADWGNRGMAGLSASTGVYAHTGVITDKSTSFSDWKYATTWNNDLPKYKMANAGTNLWTLTIPDIREFYGVPAGETIKALAFVFRTSKGTGQKEGKAINGGDIFLTLMPEGFPAAQAKDYPLGKPQLGAVGQPDGSTLFCFIAPEKNSVLLRGSWNNYAITADQQMNYVDYSDGYRYFWCRINGLEAGKDYPYFYTCDYQTIVGDPWAKLVLDGDNDKYISSTVFPNLPAYPSKFASGPVAVYNSTRDDYNWEVENFVGKNRDDLIIYELLVRDFTGTEGAARGEGTIAGVLGKLDYLKELGVNAVELMPVMEFSGNNSWGYNPNFYFAPDKAYGTPDDYRRLVDECHKRGMAVIIDVVFNQADGGHPWYQMYPTVKTKLFNGSAPHSYSVFNDWNQGNDLVTRQFEEALQYWLTAYKVDGFRFDLVKGLGLNDSYGNTYYAATNTWGTPSDANTNRYNATRVARMKQLHAAVKAVNPNAYFINENLAGAQEENEMAADQELNWANINYAACQFAMGFESGAGLNRFYAPLDDKRTWGSTISYAESHDEERMAYKQNTYGATGVKGNSAMSKRRLGSVAAQMLLTPGSHMIWQFQEFGADQTTKKNNDNDTSPKRVVWSYLNRADNAALLQSYKELIGIRNHNSALFAEDADVAVSLDKWSGGRTICMSKGDLQLLVAVNPQVSGADASIPVHIMIDTKNMKLLSASPNTTPTLSGSTVTVAPGAYAVYGSANAAGIGDVEIDESTTALPFTYSYAGDVLTVYASDGRQLGDDEVEVYSTTGLRLNPASLQRGIVLVRALGAVRSVAL